MSVGNHVRMDMRRYAMHVLFATSVVVVLPILAAYRLGGAPYNVPWLATTGLCTALSLVLGRIGAALWQRHSGSHDVVFDDLLIWGFVRRLVNQRRVLANADRLAKGLTHEKHLTALKRLAKALEAGDPYTHGHSDDVARHAYMIARQMKLPKVERDKIRLAGALHDVGKLRTPRHILTKPARLTDEEFEIIKRHPGDGAELVAGLNDPALTAIVRHHHERMDGTGYPERLSGESIPVGARIIAVADTFDAITSNRPYRATLKHKDAIAILTKEAGTQLDPAVVKAFIAYYTGRRGIRLWLSISSAVPRAAEATIPAVQRAVANAAAVGLAVVVTVAGGTLRVGTAPERAAPFAAHDHTERSTLGAHSSAHGETDGHDTTSASDPGTATDPADPQSGEGQRAGDPRRSGDGSSAAGGRSRDGSADDRGSSNGDPDAGGGDAGTGGTAGGGDTGSDDSGGTDGGGHSGGDGGGGGGNSGDDGGGGGGGSGGDGDGDDGGGGDGSLLDIIEEVVDQIP